MSISAKPVFLLAGHGIRRSGSDPMLARILAETGVHQPRAAYLGSASGDNQPFYLMMATMLRASGCGPVTLAPTVGKRANLEKARAVLSEADLIFVSGGDVEEGMRVLQERGLIGALHELYQAGKVFCGASAGSIMLAREWVRWEDPNADDSAELFPCLDIARLLCDTHGEGDGWEELQAAVMLSAEGTLGYGIRSGAGLAQHPDGRLEVFGGMVDTYIKGQDTVVPGKVLLS
ncbi:MAG: Type 1 glutamine amidotransferase-like domain-containing protein [Chloroflexi bacterium]|nr:Type 1 glutamine amidotransferase-like domain-containing protein [Chloroflexota bacterium]